MRERHDGDVLALAMDARLADRHREIVELRHRERLAVEDLVLEEDHRVGIADRALEQALRVGGRIRHHDLEAGHVRVPGGVILAVLRADRDAAPLGPRNTIGAAELPAGHVERLRRRIDDLVDRLHGEVEGHELDDRAQARERGADADAGKAVLGDRRVDHAPVAEFLQQALG